MPTCFLYRFLTTHMTYLFSKGVFRTSTVPPFFYPRAFSLNVIIFFALALKRNLLFDEHFPIHFLFFAFTMSHHPYTVQLFISHAHAILNP